MPLSQYMNVVGNAATAAVLCYSYLGSPTINAFDLSNYDVQIKAPSGITFDYYQLISKDQADSLRQIDAIHQFASNVLGNIKDLEPEFSKTVDKNFWDLI